jgi:hypothetical protein
MLLFKTSQQQQPKTRSDFESVSKDLDLWQAEKLAQTEEQNPANRKEPTV